MKTLVLANHKGGVGKSAVATLLAQYCVRRGHRVLAIDLDHQGSFTVPLTLSKRVRVAATTRARDSSALPRTHTSLKKLNSCSCSAPMSWRERNDARACQRKFARPEKNCCTAESNHLFALLPNFARACGRVSVGRYPDKRPDSRQGMKNRGSLKSS